MADKAELLKNKASLRLCERIYSTIGKIYIAICGVLIALCIIMMIYTVNGDELYIVAEILFKSVILVFGYMSCYTKKTIYAWIAPIIAVLNALVTFGVNYYLAVIFIACAALTAYTNEKYHKLEQCEGFPQFSEIYEEQKKISSREVSEYQERYDEMIKTQSDRMDEV